MTKSRILLSNEERNRFYAEALKAWHAEKDRHEAKEQARVAHLREAIMYDVGVMEDFLTERLGAIDWPRETEVSFEIDDQGRTVTMDVDLPEIEDLPEKTANVPQRGWKVTIRAISDKQKRLNYARHIHGILFRLSGEVFALLPSVEAVIV
ncbi:MAG TPA: DUF4236 domain-containing protein, partial [Gammaproteobacteria bacterium]|nr:DUF4236 domain-containing protein [Gammaproteobacteria bacterium]